MMTKSEIAKVINALAAGEDLECRVNDQWKPGSSDIKTVMRCILEHWDYRVKPTPKLRPWKPEEVPLSCFLKRKDTPEHFFALATAFPDHVTMGVISAGDKIIHWSYRTLLNEFDHTTDGGRAWKPCGVEE